MVSFTPRRGPAARKVQPMSFMSRGPSATGKNHGRSLSPWGRSIAICRSGIGSRLANLPSLQGWQSLERRSRNRDRKFRKSRGTRMASSDFASRICRAPKRTRGMFRLIAALAVALAARLGSSIQTWRVLLTLVSAVTTWYGMVFLRRSRHRSRKRVDWHFPVCDPVCNGGLPPRRQNFLGSPSLGRSPAVELSVLR